MSTEVGFIGLFIAAPNLRGRGYGKVTFMATLERLGDRNVLLDSVGYEVGRYIHFGLTSGEATVFLVKGKLTPQPDSSIRRKDFCPSGIHRRPEQL